MSVLEGVHLKQSAEFSTQLVNPLGNQDKCIRKVSLENLKYIRDQHENEKSSKIGKKRLTILFTGDTHSNLEPSIASFVSEKALGGIVRRIQYLEQTRAISNQPVLVLDAGDFLQGTAYFELFEGEAEVRFMNQAGYNVITVGNHDFDLGWPHLKNLLKQGKFDAICSNVYLEGCSESCLPPYVLLEINNQHIAVVGIMGMDSWQSIQPIQRKGLEIKEPLKVLDQILPEIRPYVDLIILLSHSGIKEDRELAKHPMVDIILGGHSHTWMTEQELIKSVTNNTNEKITSVFHSFRNGMLVGRMDVKFKDGKFSKTKSSIQYLDEQFDPKNDTVYPSVEKASSLLKEYQEKLKIFETPIGECLETLPTKDKGLGVVPIGELIANILRECGEAHVGVIPSGAIKVGIEKGPFTLGTLHRVLAHAMPLWVLTIKGSLLFSLMKQGEERWGKQRCFQYAGISINKEDSEIVNLSVLGIELNRNAFYKIAGSSFFFEREFMDVDKKILPEYSNDIQSVEEKYYDLRIPFAEKIKTNGLGKWIKGVGQ